MQIYDTGIRGYLKWLKHDQPGLYALAAPKIAALLPQAFSDFEQSKALGYLCGGDTTGAAVGDSYYYGDVVETFDPGVSSGTTPDVSSVANVGTASPTTSNTISNIIAGISQAWLAKTQADTVTKVNDIQIQRAQAGLPPLDISTLGLNVPQVNVGVAPGTLKAGGLGLAGLLLGGGLLWALFGRRRAG